MKNNIVKFSITISLIIVLLLIFIISLSSAIFSIGDMFTFGQLLVEIVLIPIFIIGFAFTIVEFRKSQETADLDIYWETNSGQETKQTTILIPTGGSGGLLTDPIAVRN